MNARICAQCDNEKIRAGCKVCFVKGKSMRDCKNFYPKMGTPMFIKWLRLGKLTKESIDKARKFLHDQLAGAAA